MSTILYDNFMDQYEKIEKLCGDSKLELSLNNNDFPIVLTVKPQWENAAQERIEFQDVDDTPRSDPDAEIKFIFGDELSISTSKDFLIDECLFNKIKNTAKKMHYAFLQFYFAQQKEMAKAKEPIPA